MDKAFPLTSVASVRWSRKLTQKCRNDEHIHKGVRQEVGLHSFSVISGQSGVVICQLWFNYKAVKTMLSNKRPLLSSLTSKNCSRRRRRRRRGVHQRGPWINDTAGEEMRGRRQAVETRHMTQSWKMWMFHLTKLWYFMLLYFISQQYHNSDVFLLGITAIMKTTVTTTTSHFKTVKQWWEKGALIIYPWEEGFFLVLTTERLHECFCKWLEGKNRIIDAAKGDTNSFCGSLVNLHQGMMSPHGKTLWKVLGFFTVTSVYWMDGYNTFYFEALFWTLQDNLQRMQCI